MGTKGEYLIYFVGILCNLNGTLIKFKLICAKKDVYLEYTRDGIAWWNFIIWIIMIEVCSLMVYFNGCDQGVLV